ncbi:MAG: hypothetical protein ACFCGT_21165 [Sandaracinaceae bacterium]
MPTPEAPRIPWLSDGAPPIDIPWLDASERLISWVCPAGWRQVAGPEASVCDPYPEVGAQECPEGEAHFPGEADCAPIGRKCEGGPFPPVDDLPPDTPLRYVRADAAEGGDGTAAAPYRTLADALDAAEEGAEVVLAAGTYEVDRAWPDGVSLRGRCVRDTILVAARRLEQSAVVLVEGNDEPIRIRDVQIGPTDKQGVRSRRAGEGAAVELRGVRIFRARVGLGEGPNGTGAAIFVEDGGRVDGRRLLIGDTQPEGRQGGAAVRVLQGSIQLRRAVIEGSRSAGIVVRGEGGPADATLEDVVVRGTRSQLSDGFAGFGILLFGAVRSTVARTLLEDNQDVGLLIVGDGAEGTVEDLVVRDTAPGTANGTGGRGLDVELGARIAASRVLIERSHEVGLFVGSAPGSAAAEAVLTELVVRDTDADANPGLASNGVGLFSTGAATLAITRGLLERNREGILLNGAGVEAAVTDVAVRHSGVGHAEGSAGRGIDVELGARLTAERVLLEGNREVGVFAGGGQTEAAFRDLVVRGTVEGNDPSLAIDGVGVFAAANAQVTLERTLLERNLEGMVLNGESLLVTASDLAVRRSGGDVPDGRAVGRGIDVEGGARLVASCVLIDDNDDLGLFVGSAPGSPATEAVLTDLVVRDTESASARPGGEGIIVRESARLELARAVVERNRLVGIGTLFGGSRASLSDVVVRGTSCSPSCTDRPPGVGLSTNGGAITAERLLVEANETCGLQIAGDGGIDLEDGAVVGHLIGICLQVPSYDVVRLRNDVAYVDNDILIDTGSRPVPMAPPVFP